VAAAAPEASALLRGWSEIHAEACVKLRQALAAQLRASQGAIEGGLRLAAARDPAEYRSHWVECWRRGFDCLRPLMSLQAQAVLFATAWGRHLAGGMRTVSEAEYRRRLAACAACDHFHDNHCLACGCRLAGDAVAKARWADEQCPLGKWEVRPTGEVPCVSS
jgi:hypothetical protein